MTYTTDPRGRLFVVHMLLPQATHDEMVRRLVAHAKVRAVAHSATPVEGPPPRVRTRIVVSMFAQTRIGAFRRLARPKPQRPLEPVSVSLEKEYTNRAAWESKVRERNADGTPRFKIEIEKDPLPHTPTPRKKRSALSKYFAPKAKRPAPAPEPAAARSANPFKSLPARADAELMKLLSYRDYRRIEKLTARSAPPTLFARALSYFQEPPAPQCARINEATEERCSNRLDSAKYQSALFCCYDCEDADRDRRRNVRDQLARQAQQLAEACPPAVARVA